MDSFEFNKIAMAVLGTVFLVMGLTFLSEGIFHSEKPEQQGYAIEVAEKSDGDSKADTGPAFDPISAMLASADISAGEKVAKKCAACHTFDEGGANKVGPALYGIVNKPVAATDGFSYSAALKAYGEGKTWTYEELNGFIWAPKKFIKGTAMGFAGLKKVEDRANMVAYLRSLAGSPAPLPAETSEPADEEPAAGENAAAETPETEGSSGQSQ